ncbi:MAG: hypothetical protein GXY07_20455 [Candidatus Hydrogenedentes bacterium]|nr:hypothetical protein [Candidatus Hydrogenedentota bacterium]
MGKTGGIIDSERNPFVLDSWIDQGYGLTAKRRGDLALLFGQTREEILKSDENKCRYPSFVGIRWGFAELQDATLVPTEKWANRQNYDTYGELKTGGATRSYPRQMDTPPKTVTVNVSARVQEISGGSTSAGIDIPNLREEMERRRLKLVALAHRDDVPMVPVEREHIIEYLEHTKLPEKPADEIRIMKEFVSSALSINQPPHRIRSRMQKILGDIPLAGTIPLCLERLYECTDFMDDTNWTPAGLTQLLEELTEYPDDPFKEHIRRTLLGLAVVMTKALREGISLFYKSVEKAVASGPEQAWQFMVQFTQPIPNVGPGLMSDFLKNIGFPEFVKIDQRLKKEFPALVPGLPTDPREMFIFAVKLCRQLGMTPFLFDHILYQWGNVKLKAYLDL